MVGNAKAIAAFVCSLVIVVGFLPLAAGDDHIILKGSKGPRMSEKTWNYTAPENGTYSWKIENFELKWLEILIYDDSSGTPAEIFKERIMFRALNAYPIGIVYTSPAVLDKGHLYEVMAIPNGQKGTYAVITDPLGPNQAPVASFTLIVDRLTVHANASSSYDADGMIQAYLWDWGDGTGTEGVTSAHLYDDWGTYTLKLTVIDNVGCVCEASQQITILST